MYRLVQPSTHTTMCHLDEIYLQSADTTMLQLHVNYCMHAWMAAAGTYTLHDVPILVEY